MDKSKRALYVIVNPKAGSGKTMHCWEPAEKRLAELGVQYVKVSTAHRGHAVQLAREAAASGYRDFMAVGGDGSLHEMLNGICSWCRESGTPAGGFRIGVIPVGSGNDWIRTLGVPHDPVRVVDMFNDGSLVPMDVIRVCDGAGKVRYMANVGGTGFDSHVCMVVNAQKAQGRRSKLIYAVGLLRTALKLKTIRIKVTADGKVVHSGSAYSMALGNGRYSGSGMRQVPLARIDDGLVDYMIVPEVGLTAILREVPRLFSGTIHKSEVVLSGRASSIVIEPLDNLSADAFEIDGEVAATLPVRVEATGSRLLAIGKQ